MYCQNCSKDVKPKVKYGWQTWMLGLVGWFGSSFLIFRHIDIISSKGLAGFVVGLIVARIGVNKFKVKICPECSHRLDVASESKESNPPKESSASKANEVTLENKQRDIANDKPKSLFGRFKHGLKEGLEDSENKDA